MQSEEREETSEADIAHVGISRLEIKNNYD